MSGAAAAVAEMRCGVGLVISREKGRRGETGLAMPVLMDFVYTSAGVHGGRLWHCIGDEFCGAHEVLDVFTHD